MEIIVALTKVRCSPMAYAIDANVNFENGDICFKYSVIEKNKENPFQIEENREMTINIRDFFQSKYKEYAFAVELNLDLSYRNPANKQVQN